ncbi:MAG: TIGR02147 family protein [Bdellovibrionaceae bacterium]|nr:TIGR02147 family protein [Pseudobdellovibrionaceae bacterium]
MMANIDSSWVSKFLKRFFDGKLKKNPRYSLRAFARDLGVSPSYLTHLLRGSRKLSLEKAEVIADRLGLRGEGRGRFIRHAAAESGVRLGARKVLDPLLSESIGRRDISPLSDFQSLTVEEFQSICDWQSLAVLEWMGCSETEKDIASIGRAFSMSQTEVIDTLSRLKELKLLVETPRGWTKRSMKLAIPTINSRRPIRQFHRSVVGHALAVMETELADSDFQRRIVLSSTVAVNPDSIEVAKSRIGQFVGELTQSLSAGPCSEVYMVSIQLVPLSKR